MRWIAGVFKIVVALGIFAALSVVGCLYLATGVVDEAQRREQACIKAVERDLAARGIALVDIHAATPFSGRADWSVIGRCQKGGRPTSFSADYSFSINNGTENWHLDRLSVGNVPKLR
jgi:hypothetical protein